MTRPESEYPGDLRPLKHDIAELKRRRSEALADVRAQLQRVREHLADTLDAFTDRRDQRRREIDSARSDLARRLADARQQRQATMANLRADFAAARDEARRQVRSTLAEATAQVRTEVGAIRSSVAIAKALRFRTGSFGDRKAARPAARPVVRSRPATPAAAPAKKPRRSDGRNFLDSISY